MRNLQEVKEYPGMPSYNLEFLQQNFKRLTMRVYNENAARPLTLATPV